MRVLTVVESLDTLNGRGRAHNRICAGLSERGHEIVVLARETTSGLGEWQTFAEVCPWPEAAWPKVLRREIVTSARGFARLVQAGVRLRPDVVYIPQRLLHTVGAALSVCSRRPLVCHLHDQPKDWDRQDRLANRRVSTKIAVSQAQEGAWRASGLGGSYVVVYNGIATGRFRPPSDAERADARAQFGVEDGEKVVAFAGRLLPGKGVHVLTAAFRQAAQQAPNLRLIMAGGDLGSDYAVRVQHASTGLHVDWLGLVERVETVYWAADLTVLPSIEHDSFPLAVLEAMACGVPAVVSRVGGLPEAIPRLLDELVVEPDDPEQLARAILATIDWRADRAQLGAQVSEHVRLSFSEGSMIDGVEAALLGAVGR